MVPAMEHYRFLIEDALVSIFHLAMEHYRFLMEDALVSIFTCTLYSLVPVCVVLEISSAQVPW